jgi:ribosomal protein L11 methyltransferase
LRSLTLTVRPEDAEAVLDRVLVAAPRGVHELPADPLAELLFYGEDDELTELERVAAGCAAVRGAEMAEAPDDWRERRARTYRPLRIGERLVVRPSWAPASEAFEGLVEVVLADEDAFGTGSHPTTRGCLAALAALAPGASLADLGCGTGVVAVAAALLGWRRVVAVDVDPSSLEATRANASRNGAEVEVVSLDLTRDPPPEAEALIANVPLGIHAEIARHLGASVPATIVASGVHPEEADQVIAAYARRGFAERDRLEVGGWAVVVVGGDG